MCKAMESEGRGDSMGKGGLDRAVPATAAAGSKISGEFVQEGPLQEGPKHDMMQSRQPVPGALGTTAVSAAAVDSSSQQLPPQQISSPISSGITTTLSDPTGSGLSTELMYLQSSGSSALSTYTAAAGLEAAMQRMRLQAGPGVSYPGQPAASTAACQADEGQPSSQASLMQVRSSGDDAQPTAEAPRQSQAQPYQPAGGGQQGDVTSSQATLFFAKVPRSATREQIEALFAAFGEVVSLNLFAPYEGSPSSKGCGLVVMGSYADAAAAIAGLDKYKWEGMHSAMVVKLMPAQRQRHEGQAQQQQQDASSGAGASSGHRSPAQASSSRFTSAISTSSRSGHGSAGQARVVIGLDVPPPGCAPDAYKLFVGNIPRAYAEQDLLPIFESIGPVRELVVLRDRVTQESKGSAFVWYGTGADADKAQLHFNMQLVLQQRSGASSRPLVVRRAAPSRQTSLASIPGSFGSYAQAQVQPAFAMAMPQSTFLHSGDPSHSSIAATAPQAAVADMGMSQLGLPYAPAASLPATAGMAAAQLYFDARGGTATMVPYMQPQQVQQVQQQQQLQQVQQQQQQQVLWQQQQQQQQMQLQGAAASAVVHCQAPQAVQYAAPVLLTMSEGYPSVLQQGSWQSQQQAQPTYVAAGYDMGQVQGVAGAPASGPLAYPPGDFHTAQQQPVMGSVVVSSLPQAIPVPQHMPAGGMMQQAQQALAGSSLSPGSNVLLSGTAGSSSSSNVGPLASYQQLGSQQHSLIIPLTVEQLNMINSQLSNVAAMSGTSITAEHNYACGSLALNVIASSRQQTNTAWQMIHSLLSQQSGAVPQAIEGLM